MTKIVNTEGKEQKRPMTKIVNSKGREQKKPMTKVVNQRCHSKHHEPSTEEQQMPHHGDSGRGHA